jgi:hypothetical protein
MSINSSIGLIQWVPTNEQACQDHTVIVNVTDIAETFDTQEFIINVTNTNDDPIITSSAVTTTMEDEVYEYQVTATDDDLLNPSNERLTFSLTMAPEGMTIETDSGLIRWLPTNDDVGDNWVNITVSDLALANNFQNFTLTVLNINDPPIITSEPIIEATVWHPYKYPLNVTEVDKGDILKYSLNTYPDNMVINETHGLITWTPNIDQEGDNPVTVRVSDGNVSDPQEFNIKVTLPSLPLVTLIFPPDNSIIDSISPTLTWSCEYPDSEIIYYDVYLHSNLSKVQTLAPISRLANNQTNDSYITPELTPGNRHYWTVIPNDGGHTGYCLSGIWWFEISETAPFNVTVGEQYRYEVKAEDANWEDVLIYSLMMNPKNMIIDADSGVILWTPSADQLGKHTVTVKVSDGKLFRLHTFEIEVTLKNNKPEVKAIPEQTIMVGEKFSHQVIASDADITDILTFRLKNAPAGMEINSTGMITWVPNKEQVGKFTIILNVTDGKDYTLTEFTVNVKKEDATSGDFNSVIQTSIIIVIILIVILLVVAMILKKRKQKKEQTDKSESLGISEQEAKQRVTMPPQAAPQTTAATPEVPQPPQTTMTAGESTVPKLTLTSSQLPQVPKVQPAPQLPPAAAATTVTATTTAAELEPEPEAMPQPEPPPEPVVPPTESPPLQESPEPQPPISDADLPSDAYVQAPVQEPMVTPSPKPEISSLTQQPTQPPSTPQTSQLTPEQVTTQLLSTSCPYCHKQVPENSIACPHCGGELQ